MAFSSPATSSIYGGIRSGAIETAVNIAHILNELPLTGSAVAVLNGDNWAEAEWPLQIVADRQRKRHNLVERRLAAFRHHERKAAGSQSGDRDWHRVST